MTNTSVPVWITSVTVGDIKLLAASSGAGPLVSYVALLIGNPEYNRR